MKQRILTGAIGILFFGVVLFLRDTIVFNLVISFITVMALWEIFAATKYLENKALLIVSMLFAAAVPFFRTPYFNKFSISATFIYIVVLLIIMLASHNKLRIEQVGLTFMMTTALPVAFSMLIYLRDLPVTFPDYHFEKSDSLFFIIIVAAGAWISDAGAYFIGYFFGKHKFAPDISPKKTVEGCIGGVLSNIVAFVVITLIYQSQVLKTDGTISMWLMIVLAVASSLAAIVGDLAASYIKRSCNIKDFGNIMPGHGGVLDRFDSFLLVAPMVYLIAQFTPIIVRF